jgi:hypothetical protein
MNQEQVDEQAAILWREVVLASMSRQISAAAAGPITRPTPRELADATVDEFRRRFAPPVQPDAPTVPQWVAGEITKTRIRVRLTDWGRAQYTKTHPARATHLEEDEGGWSEWSLYEFIAHVGASMAPAHVYDPIYTDIQLLAQ